MRFRAVYFDAGETLVYPHPSFPELFTEVLRSNDLQVDPADVGETMAAYGRKFTEAAMSGERRLWSTSVERSRTFWLEVYEGFLAEMGLEGAGRDLPEQLYRAFSDPSNYRLHPDVFPALDALSDAGLFLGLISNFEEWLEQLLVSLEVSRYFPVRIISGAVGVEKPDPEIFRLALEEGAMKAEESVYVGDHPMFDVEAAAAVGMFPVLIDRRGRHEDPPVGVRITSLLDLPAAVGVAPVAEAAR